MYLELEDVVHSLEFLLVSVQQESVAVIPSSFSSGCIFCRNMCESSSCDRDEPLIAQMMSESAHTWR